MLNKDFDVTINTRVKSTRRLRFNAIITKIRFFFMKRVDEGITLKLSQAFNSHLRNIQIPLKLKVSGKFNTETKSLTLYPYNDNTRTN